jgi:hypothetical protein
VLSLPIFEGGLRTGQFEERKAFSAEAALQVEALLRQARSEVRLGYEGVKRGEAALVSARLAANRANLVLSMREVPKMFRIAAVLLFVCALAMTMVGCGSETCGQCGGGQQCCDLENESGQIIGQRCCTVP